MKILTCQGKANSYHQKLQHACFQTQNHIVTEITQDQGLSYIGSFCFPLFAKFSKQKVHQADALLAQHVLYNKHLPTKNSFGNFFAVGFYFKKQFLKFKIVQDNMCPLPLISQVKAVFRRQ